MKPFLIRLRSVLRAALLLLVWSTSANADPTTMYADRANFLGAVRQSYTDDFSNYGATLGTAMQFDNAAMQAVNGETRFEPISFPGLNLVTDYLYRPGDYGYCAGCNGNFKLWFDDTSLSRAGGVFGVALDIVLHTSRRTSIGDGLPTDSTYPGELLIEFANGATTSFAIPADIGYVGAETILFGITDARRIRSITVGTEALPDRHFWLIDNLTIATKVPKPSTYALMLAGPGALGFAARRRKAPAVNGLGALVSPVCPRRFCEP